MRTQRRLSLKRILAVLLAVALIVASIPFSGVVVSSVQAAQDEEQNSENSESEQASVTLRFKDAGNAYAFMDNIKITVTAGADFSKEYVTGKSNYVTIEKEDYAAIAQEVTDGNEVGLSVERPGYETLTEDITDLFQASDTQQNKEKDIELSSQVPDAVCTVEFPSSLTYKKDEEQALISKVDFNGGSEENPYSIEKDDDTGKTTSVWYDNIKYQVNDGELKEDYSDIKAKNAGEYDIYIMVTMNTKVTSTDKDSLQEDVEESDSTELRYHYRVSINKAERTDFNFKDSTSGSNLAATLPDIAWNESLEYSAESAQESGDISYSVKANDNDYTKYAHLDESKLTFDESAVGKTYTVTAVMKASDNYKEAETSYSVTVKKVQTDEYSLQYSNTPDGDIKITYKENDTYTNQLVDKNDNVIGNVTYTIESQQDRDGNKITDAENNVASIDENTGELTYTKAGIVMVKAVLPSDYYDGTTEYSYTLNISRAEQKISFGEGINGETLEKEYGSVLDYTAAFVDSDSSHSENSITYSVTQSPTQGSATIDSATGELNVAVIGTIVITATVDGDDCYAPAEATYTVNAVKAKPDIKFDVDSVDVYYSTDTTYKQAVSNNSNLAVKYTVDVKKYNNQENIKDLAINSEDGTVTLPESIAAYEENPGDYITVTAAVSVPEGETDFYEATSVSYKIYLKKEVTTNLYYDVPAYDNSNTGYYYDTVEYSMQEDTGYLIGTSPSKDESDYSDKLTFEETTAAGTVYYLDKETKHIITGPQHGEIKIDKNPPRNLELTYSGIKFDSLSNFIFGTTPAKDAELKYLVTISVYDDGDDIESITYKGILSDGSTGTTEFTQGVTVGKDDLEKGTENHQKVYSFAIPEEFEGKIAFTVTDAVGHSASYNYQNGETLVVDDSTNVSVTYANAVDSEDNTAEISNQKRTITIVTNEKYFYSDGVTVEGEFAPFGKEAVDIKNYKNSTDDKTFSEYLKDNSNWTNVEGTNQYKCTYTFTEEGTYNIEKVECKDRSGNTASDGAAKFKIDTIAPNVSVSFKNSAGTVTGYSQLPVTAVISIYEAGSFFDDETGEAVLDDNISLEVKATDFSGNEIEVTLPDGYQSFNEYIKDKSKWQSDTNGNHTIEVPFTSDANYSIVVNYKDASGNTASSDSDASKEKTFIFDSTMPEVKVTYKDEGFIRKVTNAVKKIFGYYNPKVEVVVTPEDKVSGVDKVYYKKNATDSWHELEAVNGGYSFTTSDESTNNFIVKVVDKAGNDPEDKVKTTDGTEGYYVESEDIIVDSTRPEAVISYNSQPSEVSGNIKYYQDTVEAVLTVTDANFNPEIKDSDGNNTAVGKIKIEKSTDNGSSYSDVTSEYAAKIGELSAWSQKDNTYTISFKFEEEAQYRITGSVKDCADNESGSLNEVFVVDKTAPVINVEYDNNSAENGNYYNSDRTAAVKITEHNFDSSKVEITVTAKDNENNSVMGSDLSNVLKNVNFSVSWKSENDVYELKLPYSVNANYTFEISVKDSAGNSTKNFTIGSSTEAVVKDEFVVDKTRPEAVITMTGANGVDNESWNKSWKSEDGYLTGTSFTLYSKETVKVAISDTDNLSGIDKLEYYRTDEYLTTQELQSNKIVWTESSDVSKAEFNIEPDERFIVYVCVTDKAGNKTYLCSDGVIADKNQPTISQFKIDIEPAAEQEWYTEDVPFNVDITDIISTEKNSSGIKSISYTVSNNVIADADNRVTQSGVLYQPDKVEYSYNEEAAIIVDSKKNNSDDVTVKIKVEDNAGNVSTQTVALKIDITAPVINVDYEDAEYDTTYGDGKAYFEEQRVVKVTVTERNFDADKFVMSVTSVDGNTPQISSWEKIDGTEENGDDTKHCITYVFEKDDEYTIGNISYTDKAGWKIDEAAASDKEKFVYNTDVYTKNFVIATTAPELTVKYYTETGAEISPTKYYYNYNIKIEFTVKSHYFYAGNTQFTMEEGFPKDFNGELVAMEESYAAQLKNSSNWIVDEVNNDIRRATILVSTDAQYEFDIQVFNRAKVIGNPISGSFIVDKEAPQNLEIVYDTPSVVEKVLDGIKHLFFNQEKLSVSLYANDKTSGVDKIEYSVDGGETYKTVESKDIVYMDAGGKETDKSIGESVRYTFDIDAQYRGQIKFKATDKSGLESDICDDGYIAVVDTIAPSIQVEYSSAAGAVNDSYYSADRIATITVTEGNFYPENVEMTITRRLNAESSYKNVTDSYAKDYQTLSGWTSLGDNKYQKTIIYNEDADYTFEMSVKDYSGHEASYGIDEFTVDKINPVIAVAYDNNSARNNNQFNDTRNATITITEHNFRASDVDIDITAVDAAGNAVNQEYITDILNKLREDSAWVTSGDVHTAAISYIGEANYTFDIKCTDLSGRINSDENGYVVDYGSSVAPTEFTVDTVTPYAAVSITNSDVDWNASKNGSVWSSGNGSDGYLENFTYSLWTNKAVTVSITTSDALSNVEYIEYYKTDSILTENQLRYDSTIQWSRGVNGLTSFTVAPDEKFIVYAHVVDKAGNETFVASDGIIVDETQPTMSEFSPRVIVSPQQPVNNIYNTDVTMDVYTFDPVTGNNSYSGFDSITYVVRNMGEETQSGTLYSFGKDEASFDELLQTWTGEFSVSSSLNNSNDVDIVITAVDNAGNVTVATSAVQIDITNPSIEVSYDNNSGDSSVGDTTYFNAERTATVSITERNFNSDDVEITVTNTDGVMPDISNWSTESGGGNGDEDVHTATIRYYADGDYTFDISFKDMVGNDAPEEDYGSSAAPTEFTIDMTNPVISVSYDYNDAANGNYYNQVRTATVTIEEHNFETSRINTTLSADGGEGGVPQISDWSTSGDTHTATVVYSGDTLYTFAMEYSDMAGNAAESIAAESFYVDVTKPQTSIDGISKFANAGEVAPVVTFQDTYYDSVEITLTGANTGEQVIDGKGSYSVGDTGGTFTFNNLDIDDDVYTLKVTATDKAGNVSDDDSVVFALNREGSVYVVDSDSNVNGKYLSSGQDIVIREINVNSLSAQKITLFKNDQTIVLTEGTDYSIAIEGSDEIGYTYIYTIFKKNFEDDGVYRISVYSEDAAGNVAENTIETKAKYEAEMSFAVDKTGPKIIMLNIESGKTYSTNRLEAQMSVNDNLKLSKVEVYLDGESNAVWNEADIKQLSGSGSDFMFYIDGGSTKAHTVQAVAEDAAGNKNQLDLEDIYVTTNIWIRYYTNKALFYGSIGGAATLSCASGGLVFFRRRRIKIHKLIK